MTRDEARILVFDDEGRSPRPVILDYEGYDVTAAPSGPEGVGGREASPDLLVLEVKIPAWTASRRCSVSGGSPRRCGGDISGHAGITAVESTKAGAFDS